MGPTQVDRLVPQAPLPAEPAIPPTPAPHRLLPQIFFFPLPLPLYQVEQGRECVGPSHSLGLQWPILPWPTLPASLLEEGTSLKVHCRLWTLPAVLLWVQHLSGPHRILGRDTAALDLSEARSPFGSLLITKMPQSRCHKQSGVSQRVLVVRNSSLICLERPGWPLAEEKARCSGWPAQGCRGLQECNVPIRPLHKSWCG